MKKFINQFESLQSSMFFSCGYIAAVVFLIYGIILAGIHYFGILSGFGEVVPMLFGLAGGALLWALIGEVDLDSIIRKYYNIFYLYKVTSSPSTFLPKNEEEWRKYLAYCKTDDMQNDITKLATLWAGLMQAEMKAKGQNVPSTSVILSCCAAACQQTKLDDARYYAAAVLSNHWLYGESIHKAMI